MSDETPTTGPGNTTDAIAEDPSANAPASGKPPTNPDDYTKDELIEIAEDLGVDPGTMTKAELAAAIDAAGGVPTPEEEILLEEKAAIQEEADNFDPYTIEGTAEYEDRQVALKAQADMDAAIADGTVEAPPGYVAPEPAPAE